MWHVVVPTGGWGPGWVLRSHPEDPSLNHRNKIQLIYCNSFSSVWDYAQAVEVGGIDWGRVLGRRCPLCEQECRFRKIRGYRRRAVELFPVYRDDSVLVMRFQCRSVMRTFSALPHQLVPYHHYTADSIAWAVWFVAWLNATGVSGCWDRALNHLPPSSNATAWLLRCWLGVLLRGLRGGHPVLQVWVDLRKVRSGPSVSDHLPELATYLGALGIRAPPAGPVVAIWLERFGASQRRFLLGIPSQHRPVRPPA